MFQLLGFSDPAPTGLDKEIDGFLLKAPSPSSSDVSNFLKLYSKADRPDVARLLIARGVSAATISSSMMWLSASDRYNPAGLFGILTIVSGAASAYHGYKRNQSIGWAAWWFLMGTVFPVITPVIGVAQGFGQRRSA